VAELQPVLSALPTLAIATVYCLWHARAQALQLKQRLLRERVTWMLWVMANDVETAHDQ